MKVEIDLPEIEGYEYTGEYRVPKRGEYYFFKDNDGAWAASGDVCNNHHILRKKRWRAEYYGAYWIIDTDGYIHKSYEYSDLIGCRRYELGNYFQTREEAEAVGGFMNPAELKITVFDQPYMGSTNLYRRHVMAECGNFFGSSLLIDNGIPTGLSLKDAEDLAVEALAKNLRDGL